MPTVLRQSTKQKVVDLLEKTHFTASSFEVTYRPEFSEFFRVVFTANRAYYYTITEPAYQATTYTTEEAPGVHIESGESYRYDSLNSALKGLTAWAERIHEDYRARNPIVDELASFREAIAKQIEEHINDQDAHFTPEEGAELREKIDDLASRLAELSERASVSEAKLKEALADLEKVKADIELFPKGVWYRVATSKVVNAVKKS